MDERQRLENVDLYGAAAFFGDGFLVTRAASQYNITQGIGYVGGLRCKLPATQNITVTTKPVKVWADVCWKGTLTSVWAEELKITVANTLANYVQDGVQHYVFAVANIDANGVITDLRPKGSLDGQQGNKDFLRIDKSLSEIATKGVQAQAEARKNLALGDAATKNVQKSVTDSTPNALMINGAWGLGASGVGMVDSDILSPTSIGNTFFNQGGGAANSHFGGYGTGIHLSYGSNGDNKQRLTANLFVDSAGNLSVEWLAVNKSDGATVVKNIQKLYGPLNKPSAADVRAIPFFGGISAGTNLNTLTEPGIWFNPANANASLALNYPSTQAGSLQVLQDAGVTQIYTEYSSGAGRQWRRGLYSGVWSAWRVVYDSYNKPSASDVGALPIVGGTLNGNLTVKNQIQVGSVGNGFLAIGDNDSGLRSSVDGQVDLYANGRMYGYWNTGVFSFTGQIIPSNYNNFDARYQAKGNYTPAGEAYTKAVSDTRFQPKGNYTPAGEAYTKAVSDARFQPKGNYTPAGEAYTKGESDGRYMRDVRLGTQARTGDGSFTIPAGCVVTSVWSVNWGVHALYYKPIQRNINGTWVTISG